MSNTLAEPPKIVADTAVPAIDQIIKDPASHFASPNEVVENPGYSDGEKVEILRAWELDAYQRQIAADENMSGGEGPDLQQVEAALKRMGLSSGIYISSTKLGS